MKGHHGHACGCAGQVLTKEVSYHGRSTQDVIEDLQRQIIYLTQCVKIKDL